MACKGTLMFNTGRASALSPQAGACAATGGKEEPGDKEEASQQVRQALVLRLAWQTHGKAACSLCNGMTQVDYSSKKQR